MEESEKIYGGEWTTVSLTRTPLGLTATERSERFRPQAVAELALRLAGGLMVAASMLLWLVLPMQTDSPQVVSHGVLAALMTGVGLAVYAYGTRGFRRRLSLDARRRTLALTKININGQSRVVRTFALSSIESLFLRRSAAPLAQASLFVRVVGHDAPLLALTGAKAELERIHYHLCDIVQGEAPHGDPHTVHGPARLFARLVRA